MPSVIAKSWRGAACARRLLRFGILGPAVAICLSPWSPRVQTLHLFPRPVSRAPGTGGSRGVAVASGGCLRLCGPLEAFSFDLLDHHARRPRLIGFTNEATEETLETGLTGRSPDSRSKGETRIPVRRRRAYRVNFSPGHSRSHQVT